jgi:serine/threonine protein kinase
MLFLSRCLVSVKLKCETSRQPETKSPPSFFKRTSNEQEAKVIKSIRSNYVSQFRSFTYPSTLEIEQVQGPDLLQFFNSLEGSGLHENEILFILRDVLLGIRDIHQSGFYHLDIKPENIVLTRNEISGGQSPVLKIVDFDCAQSSQYRGPVDRGTLAYLPREALQEGGVTESTDLYSVGVIAFLLLTGQPLVDPSQSDEEILTQLNQPDFMSTRIKELKESNKEYSEKLIELVEKLLKLKITVENAILTVQGLLVS